MFLQDVPRVLDENDTIVLEAGELFGELAALTRSPRSATVFAEDDAVLVEIRWQGLRDLMRRTDALRRHVERLYRENSLRVHLRETPLLADLPPTRSRPWLTPRCSRATASLTGTRRTSRPCGGGRGTRSWTSR